MKTATIEVSSEKSFRDGNVIRIPGDRIIKRTTANHILELLNYKMWI